MQSKNDTPEISNTKNLLCRDAYVKEIIKRLGYSPFKEGKGCHIRECPNGASCRGAHSQDEIRPLPHISKWERTDKSTFNFPELYDEILTVINKEKYTLKDSSQFKSRLEKSNELNFIELIQLWREMACHYRKIAKELPRKNSWQSSEPPKAHTSGYVYSNDVPGFYLSDSSEDSAWAFEKMTKFCKTRTTFIDNINKRIQITIWDLCLGDKNCKEGIHKINEQICADDFLTGKCECMSKDKYDEEYNNIKNTISEIKQKLADKTIKPKRREQLLKDLEKKEDTLNVFLRKIHYTEKGMKPFEIQYKEHIEKKKQAEILKNEELEKQVKPNWDHSLAKQNDATVGKVIKVSLKKK